MTDPGQHLFWITSRASGTVSLILASLSMIVGLLIAGRLLTGGGRGGDYRSLHEALSLGALATLALHGLALLGDGYLHPGVIEIAVPFVGRYRPPWTGIGIIGGWALVALGLSYYARQRIGLARWRALHRLTSVAWILSVIHTIQAGTDARQLWYLIVIAVPVLPAALLLVARLSGRRPVEPAAGRPTPTRGWPGGAGGARPGPR